MSPMPRIQPEQATPNERSQTYRPSFGQNLSLSPLKFVKLAKVHPLHQFHLADQGWSTITFDDDDKLHRSSQALFAACKTFFDLPVSQKEAFKSKLGSEEGWNYVEGEKEFITLRTMDFTPEVLKQAGSTFWKEAVGLLNQLLGQIAESLELRDEAFTVYSKPCMELDGQRRATMLRLFRYEVFEGDEARLVAEGHKDLGLLSLVIGDKPGLEVADHRAGRWFSIERSYTYPAASLLVGRQLERLSNGRYAAGGHRVQSYPDAPIRPSMDPEPPAKPKSYRYSIVFILRAHSPISVNTDELTTHITGAFKNPLKNLTMGDVCKFLKSAHYNINTALEDRDEQKRKLQEARKKGTPLPPLTHKV